MPHTVNMGAEMNARRLRKYAQRVKPALMWENCKNRKKSKVSFRDKINAMSHAILLGIFDHLCHAGSEV